MNWSRLMGVGLAVAGGFALLSSATHADTTTENGFCIDVFSEPAATYLRHGLGSNDTATLNVNMNVDGVSEVAAVTFDVSGAPSKVKATFDFGGGDAFSVDADLISAGTHYDFGAAYNFVGTGSFAGGTSALTFQFANGNYSAYVASSPSADGPRIVEWSVRGQICFTPEEPEGVCENGKPDTLTIRYTGEGPSASSHTQDPSMVSVIGDPNFASPIRIRVTDKRKLFDSKAKVYFDGLVNVGGTIVMDAATIGTRYIRSTTVCHLLDANGDLVQYVEFHTSCSQPLNTGDQFGSIEVVDFTTGAKGKPASTTSKGKGKNK